MSNLACIPPKVAKELNMMIETPKDGLRFGSYSHDGTITVHQLAKDSVSRYLPEFAVTTTGKMAILPASWLSQMGYGFHIHSHEKGFSVINQHTGNVTYEAEPHTDTFHYIPWSILRGLNPTTDREINYIDEVEHELDKMNESSSSEKNHKMCNATQRQRRAIRKALVRMIREAHSRTGHQNARQMAETIARQARSDMTPYTGEDVITVMDRWPCIFCKPASQKRGSTNVGSGVKPSMVGEEWSMDTKMGYAEVYHWGFNAIHIFIDTATGKSFYRGFKMPDNATEVKESIRKLLGYCSARDIKVKTLITDAGKINLSADVRKYLEKKHITPKPVQPKVQFRNPVEKFIDVWENKMEATIATAR
jgi:hypothetical protein